MPKERTHWFLAARAQSRVRAGKLADALLAFPEYLFAGAIAHDSGYYLKNDPDARSVAERLHGNGGDDSFEPFRRLAARVPTLPEGLAFGFGALTHLAADAVFHPIIFSWTGFDEVDDDEVRRSWPYRHAACETALDSHLEALWGPSPEKTVARLRRRGGTLLVRLQSEFSGVDAGPLLAAQARWQRWFHHPAFACLARVRARGCRGSRGDESCLFYPRKAVPHPAFSGSLEWVDPTTGQQTRATLGALLEKYDAFIADLAAEWADAWESGREPFPGAWGPCLDTGISDRKLIVRRFAQLRWF